MALCPGSCKGGGPRDFPLGDRRPTAFLTPPQQERTGHGSRREKDPPGGRDFQEDLSATEGLVKELAEVYKKLDIMMNGALAEADRLAKAIKTASDNLEGQTSEVKGLVERARKVKGDLETILRREEEAFAYFQDLEDHRNEADKAAKKKPEDKELKKKAELANKAYEKQYTIYYRVTEKAHAIKAAISEVEGLTKLRPQLAIEAAKDMAEAIGKIKLLPMNFNVRFE